MPVARKRRGKCRGLPLSQIVHTAGQARSGTPNPCGVGTLVQTAVQVPQVSDDRGIRETVPATVPVDIGAAFSVSGFGSIEAESPVPSTVRAVAETNDGDVLKFAGCEHHSPRAGPVAWKRPLTMRRQEA